VVKMMKLFKLSFWLAFGLSFWGAIVSPIWKNMAGFVFCLAMEICSLAIYFNVKERRK